MTSQKQSYKRISAAFDKDLFALVIELSEIHLNQFPDDLFAWMWYAMAKIKLHQYSQGQKAIRRVISLCKGEQRVLGIAYKEMGNLFEAKGDLRAATAWYQRGLQVCPKRDFFTYLGYIASKQGLLNQAESYHRKAVKHPASCTDEAYFNLGGILVAKRQYREAIQCYRKALKLDPKDINAKTRLRDAALALKVQDS